MKTKIENNEKNLEIINEEVSKNSMKTLKIIKEHEKKYENLQNDYVTIKKQLKESKNQMNSKEKTIGFENKIEYREPINTKCYEKNYRLSENSQIKMDFYENIIEKLRQEIVFLKKENKGFLEINRKMEKLCEDKQRVIEILENENKEQKHQMEYLQENIFHLENIINNLQEKIQDPDFINNFKDLKRLTCKLYSNSPNKSNSYMFQVNDFSKSFENSFLNKSLLNEETYDKKSQMFTFQNNDSEIDLVK